MPGSRPALVVRRLLLVLLALAGVSCLAPSSRGQPQLGNQLPQARLATLMPCGGKAASTFEVILTGADLDGAEALLFSHPGITATVIPPPPPQPDPKPKDPKVKVPQKQPPPPMPKFSVSIDPSVPVGFYDVRFVGKRGITNARTFVVGDLTEVREKEPNNDVDQAQRVEINSTVTGTIADPIDVDYYVFAGSKGQRVLIQCLCATIDSKLTPEIKVVDKENRELAVQRAAPLTDGFVDVTLPEDGDYRVRLVQSAHQLGGAELFYRLNITTGPWIDAVFPPMVEQGKAAQVTLYGRNLPGGTLDPGTTIGGCTLEKLTVTVKAPRDDATLQRLAFGGHTPPALATLDGFEYRIQNQGRLSNPVLLTYARAPVVLEQEPNDTPEIAQLVQVPCEIAGRIDTSNDRDWYTFTAKKGDTFIIEVFSQRLGAPTDMYLTIRNATGKQVTDMVQLDDNGESLNQVQFATASRDPPPYRFVAPADGRYQLAVGSHISATHNVRHIYKIRIAPAQPDFRLFVMPADTYRPEACMLGAGGNQDLTVFVWRQDGWSGEVAVSVEGLPAGVTYKPQVIGPGVKQGAIVLNADLDAQPWAGTLVVKGTGTINGKSVEREARPASITWQVPPLSGILAISRLERSLALAVRDKAPYNLACGVDKMTVVHGGKATIPLKLTRHRPDFQGPVQIVPLPNELPPGVSFANVAMPQGKDAQNLILNVPANVVPGNYTFVFKSFAGMPLAPKGKGAVNVVQCSTAIVLTVLPKQVATVSVSNNAPALKPGTEMELVVKVTRKFEYNDSFTVKLVLPPEVKGISADEVTIPASHSEVRLLLRAAEDAAPGPRNNVTIRAVAVLQGFVLTQETKINVNVLK